MAMISKQLYRGQIVHSRRAHDKRATVLRDDEAPINVLITAFLNENTVLANEPIAAPAEAMK